MTAPGLAEIGPFLDRHTTMTLATTGPADVWAAALFFARDEALNLYFISSPETRHARDIESNPAVAVTVNGDVRAWADIQGVQIAGMAARLSPDRRNAVEALYFAHFPDIARLLKAPAGDDERKIATGFAAGHYYCVTPRTIRLIDNTRAFGFSAEFTLGD